MMDHALFPSSGYHLISSSVFFYKSNLTLNFFASLVEIPETTCRDVINRVRGPLLEYLQGKWCNNLPRPHKNQVGVPFCALAVDSTDIYIQRPYGTTNEGKIYFDGKHERYACKRRQLLWWESHTIVSLSSRKDLGQFMTILYSRKHM